MAVEISSTLRSHSSRCPGELPHPSFLPSWKFFYDPTNASKSLLMTWVLLSYLPQYARIVTRRSAEGVSTLYVLLGSLSGVCAAGNIAVLPSSEDGFTCCGHVTRFACIGALVGLGQVGVGVACFWGV